MINQHQNHPNNPLLFPVPILLINLPTNPQANQKINQHQNHPNNPLLFPVPILLINLSANPQANQMINQHQNHPNNPLLFPVPSLLSNHQLNPPTAFHLRAQLPTTRAVAAHLVVLIRLLPFRVTCPSSRTTPSLDAPPLPPFSSQQQSLAWE
eukprot:CAMPEP_0201112000 /NCGR_PEP_ID=MMETSP0812-20130820/76972_1 /ASSEMBLY_ACC=CAM_ASM_000668 /TAXON_ID=98059 /ORGANISM="Dinobryon sp., Strain UTEXLB2267" /LENGTH=152 /DNA_ID=CAMNT_0047375221 /DNA_START=251 /DNA_END=709 /DNA_ORIENTATION=+